MNKEKEFPSNINLKSSSPFTFHFQKFFVSGKTKFKPETSRNWTLRRINLFFPKLEKGLTEKQWWEQVAAWKILIRYMRNCSLLLQLALRKLMFTSKSPNKRALIGTNSSELKIRANGFDAEAMCYESYHSGHPLRACQLGRDRSNKNVKIGCDSVKRMKQPQCSCLKTLHSSSNTKIIIVKLNSSLDFDL